MFSADPERVDNSMDAADLKVFAAVARIGGMNRAANELHTVQSNVTARARSRKSWASNFFIVDEKA